MHHSSPPPLKKTGTSNTVLILYSLKKSSLSVFLSYFRSNEKLFLLVLITIFYYIKTHLLQQNSLLFFFFAQDVLKGIVLIALRFFPLFFFSFSTLYRLENIVVWSYSFILFPVEGSADANDILKYERNIVALSVKIVLETSGEKMREGENANF